MPHIHEKVDFIADVFIVYRDKVFLRMHDKHKIWLSVGGHVELDEDPVEAAIREAKEEAGLDVELIGTATQVSSSKHWEFKELLPPAFMNRHRISPTHEHISLTYFATAKTDKIAPTGDDISNEWRWVTEEELDDMDLLPNIRHYAREALRAARKLQKPTN